MTTETRADFEITGWDQHPYDSAFAAEGRELATATVRKTFTGALIGTSVAQLMTVGQGDGRGYLATEEFDGSLDGRAGGFVMQHGGVGDAQDAAAFGNIVPGSGTGELVGIHGTVEYQHDESGARVFVRYALRA
ncbi:DUF3224 domain-containing protein [Rhodococcoides yunnanense]|uniref:DUF3224 domain-containing protein n=1 Tax=Rhodococcoides yunnanense TaxID=278209 RepID=UPI0009327420|nr:DUF3224 domain-containing protein [Rhodococcus yunnanensis]